MCSDAAGLEGVGCPPVASIQIETNSVLASLCGVTTDNDRFFVGAEDNQHRGV